MAVQPQSPPIPECVTVEPERRDDGTIDWDKTREKLNTALKDEPADDTGLPAATAAYNTLYAQEQERDIVARMAEIDQRVSGVPGTNIGDWPPGIGLREHSAYLVDEALAKSTPCVRVDLGEGQFLVYSEGLVGALDDTQIAKYCTAGINDLTITPRQQQRLIALAQSAPTCSVESQTAKPEEQLDKYFDCLGKQLRKRGVSS